MLYQQFVATLDLVIRMNSNLSTFRIRDHELHHHLAEAYLNKSGNSIYINVYIIQRFIYQSVTCKKFWCVIDVKEYRPQFGA